MIEIRTHEDAEPAHPDGPQDPEQTRAIASGIDDAFRLLNYATMSRAGLRYPSEVYSVLGELAGAVAKLPQALEQMNRFVRTEVTQGHARDNARYSDHGGDAEVAAGALAIATQQAAGIARDLSQALQEAQAAVRGMESTRGEDDDQ